MTPFLFGTPARRLFGIDQPPGGAAGAARAVLLCKPFGHEAVRIHRLYRVLGDRLSRAGIHVLRFDFYGTGDSGGDDGQGDLDGWAEDLQVAHAELRRRSAAHQIIWIGARLGATVALRALADGEAPQRLLLWDPIVDGAGYAEELRAKHVQALEVSYSLPDPAWRRRLRDDPTAFADEAIGFAMAPALQTQLRQLAAESLTLPPTLDTRVIADPQDAGVAAWCASQRARGARLREVALPRALDWTSDDSLNTALVPAEALAQLKAACDE